MLIYRNLDWLYSTPTGRQQIIASAQYTTIVFIYLQSDEDYRDLEQVKSEMTEAVLDFKPMNLSNNLQVREGGDDIEMKRRGRERSFLRFHSCPLRKALVK